MSGLIEDGERLTLDSSCFIAYLDGTEATSPASRWVMDDLVSAGRCDAIASTVTISEVLVQPVRRGPAAVRTVTSLIDSLETLQVRNADYLVAAEAARIRAETGIPLPDAIVIATAVLTSSQVLVTNDRRLADASRRAVPELRVVVLSEVAAV